jgi:hypothetical protein
VTVSEQEPLGTAAGTALTYIAAAALQNYPQFVRVTYVIVAWSNPGRTCPLGINASTGALYVARNLVGTEDSGTVLNIEVRDVRVNCTQQGRPVVLGGCTNRAQITLQVAYFIMHPGDLVRFVTEPNTRTKVTWTPPQLQQGVFIGIQVNPSQEPGSMFQFGATQVWYNASGFTGTAAITLSFTVTVTVGYPIELLSVGHFFSAASERDPHGTATDYLLDSTRTFGWLLEFSNTFFLFLYFFWLLIRPVRWRRKRAKAVTGHITQRHNCATGSQRQ